ncbi:DNA-directed RNA polymerase I subunit RPA12 [Protomyces lactucae-debilis]|uniref:DNA-directed RNA polymerase subunit n=1 Tax=Protomyces lactucae-debilis TaxID=2754530 RepID=A0A1Y2F0U7_PROLT|nr:DNA-directed RNA polymerase I subunit RPA12 [Protomyces lactucae-debilis]ORY76966.1 DNA-directed RNA polymerase I subunit RPA12 [Protomyces lactucae-debilis]
MSVVGSLIFCTGCGTLLDPPTSTALTCTGCGASFPSAQFKSLSVTTRSAPGAFPSVLKQKRSVVHVPVPSTDDPEGLGEQHGGNTEGRATIEEKCVKCGNEQMTFFTLQLRSADEGSTVFYECPRCAYRFSTNN